MKSMSRKARTLLGGIYMALCLVATLIVLNLEQRASVKVDKQPQADTAGEMGTSSFRPPPFVEVLSFEAGDGDYEAWKTYRNKKFGYSLRYPADWKIDNSLADVDHYESGTCCQHARLELTNGSASWELSLQVLFTGGEGIDGALFTDVCTSGFGSNYAVHCEFKYYGPINLGNILSKPYLRVLFDNKSKKILHGTVGGPVFEFREHPNEDPEVSLGGIDYSGNVNDYIELLNKITASLRFD